MSIVIGMGIPEGIVLAADSRQSYTNAKGNSRVGSEHGAKLFQLTSRIGVTTFGWAFLQSQGASIMASIGSLIEDFRTTVDPNISVVDAANQLAVHLNRIYQYDITTLKWTPAPTNQFALGLEVAGYNQNSTEGEIYQCLVPPGNSTLLRKTHNPGCNWHGQTDVITRLVLGYDPRIANLPFAAHLSTNPILGQQTIGDQLQNLQYQINWHTMTLQDAIDFVTMMINTTINMQRFSDGIILNPGDMPGCGGNIDVAVITHKDGYKWIKKKELKAE